MGDPGSPLAFLLYLADFDTPAHHDDISLDGVTISHLEHADDMVLLSTSPEGLQSKLDALGTWASRNQMEVNARKTVVMIFNRPRTTAAQPATAFHIYGLPLEIVQEVRYVGVWFCTDSTNLWECHFKKGAQKARRAANVAFFVESHTGAIPPWQGRSLYTTQVDPHLIWGTAVTGLGTLTQQGRLESVQLAFLRRLLRVQKRSQKCILFTETGLWPLRFRRLDMQLRFLQYAVARPDDHLVSVALRAQENLAAAGRQCWLSDLRRNLYNVAVDLPQEWTEKSTSDCLTQLKESMLAHIESEVTASPKLDLLQYRGELDAQGHRRSPVLKFRSYLRISDRALRDAITRTLLSDHRLAIELLRRRTPERPYRIPPRARLCRLCLNSIEDPLHALFACSASMELLECRETFWDRYSQLRQNASSRDSESRSRTHVVRLPTLAEARAMRPVQTLHTLLENEESAVALGSLMVRVYGVYDATPLYVSDWEPEWEDGEGEGEN
ncbi:hypothetical protein AURDEDRAFT_63893 [Auricularia subglabra TFB-10046 SS5]|nr:hypothetical protein AURDEDRAFT_63893 [Auricularia subglabra TFB-10046 SS5]